MLAAVVASCCAAKALLVPDGASGAEAGGQVLSQSHAGKSARADSMQFPQSGQAYSSLPYWDGTIADSGCGLCAYTSAADILLDADYTPADMLELRGDWSGMDAYLSDGTGSAAVGTHNEWSLSTLGIYACGIGIDSGSLASAIDGGGVAIACASGARFLDGSGGVSDYPGHFVCVYAHDASDGSFRVHDPSFPRELGCAVRYSADQMEWFLGGCSQLVSYSRVA